MNEIQEMAYSTSLALLCHKREAFIALQKDNCDAGVATASGEPGVLDKAVQLPVVGNVWCLILEETNTVLHLWSHWPV